MADSDNGVPFGLDDAAAEVRRLAASVEDDRLDGPTPCAGWTVRDLLAHLCGLTRAFTATARHETAGGAPPTALPEDWRVRLDRDLDDLVAAWREPAAWEGEAEAGGMTMPSAELAVVVLDELVLHGWDLAVATDQQFSAATRDVEICTRFAEAMSTPDALESREGLYGPVRPVPDDATPLQRLLALAGRDPLAGAPAGGASPR
ncbi:TIGR03086 family protein [Phycicoccus sp. CMS6Z-2]|nr:TIGR03086 family protein [Phycicoccus flavus]